MKYRNSELILRHAGALDLWRCHLRLETFGAQDQCLRVTRGRGVNALNDEKKME